MRVSRRLSVLILASGVSLLGARFADADVISADDPPAHITFTDGEVWLDRESESQPAEVGLVFLPGDRLRSTVGRTEILFPDGTALHLDDGASVELLSPNLLRLTSGRLRLIAAGTGTVGRATSFQIDTPAASALVDGPGEYRVALFDGPSGVETELAVARGWGTLSTDAGDLSLRPGERSIARRGELPSRPYTFNAAAFDTFDLWSIARRDARNGRSQYSTHLPRELQMYGGILEHEGNWHQEAGYGYVWYPSVPVGWQPYSHGHWNDLPVYGWTWIGASAWHWPTHHYGSWAHVRSRWFWVPGRTWRPAWVHWAAAPGYVGWSPWGYAPHATFNFSFAIGHPGWVVVPRASFGHRGAPYWGRAQYGPPRGSTFVVQDAPPVPHNARGTRMATEPARRVPVPRGSPRVADRSIVRFPDARRAPPSASAVTAAPPSAGPSSAPRLGGRQPAPSPNPAQGAPATARPPRTGWAAQRAVTAAGRSTESIGRFGQPPRARAPAAPMGPAPAPAPAPRAGTGSSSSRTEDSPGSGTPVARGTPSVGRGVAARAPGGGSSGAAARASGTRSSGAAFRSSGGGPSGAAAQAPAGGRAQVGPRGAAPAGGSTTGGRGGR